MSENTKRNPNFTISEISILMNLVLKYKSIIESKQTNRTSALAKTQKWRDIEIEFNANSGGVHRTYDGLKKKYENLKKESKQKYAEEKKSLYATGGGPGRPVEINTETDIIMKDILGTQIKGLDSIYDSDILNGKGEPDDVTIDIDDNVESKETASAVLDMNHNEQEVINLGNMQKLAKTDKFVIGKKVAKQLLIAKKTLTTDKWQLLAEKKNKDGGATNETPTRKAST